MNYSVYSLWRSDARGVTLAAEIRPDDAPPPEGTLTNSTRPPVQGETIVCRMASGLPENIADELARAYIETMEARARGANVTVGGKRMPLDAGRPTIATLAIKHSVLRWPKKRRNMDLRRHGYDPDGADGKMHRTIFAALTKQCD